MFYGGIGITINGRIDIYIIRNGTLTKQRYRDEISRPIESCVAAIGDKLVLIDDNYMSLRAHLT